MADKQIKVKFTGDASNFDRTVDQTKKKIEGLGGQTGYALKGISNKLLHVGSQVAAIAKGIESWIKVLKYFVLDRPIEQLRNFIDYVADAKNSLAEMMQISAGRKTYLNEIIKEMREMNESGVTWDANMIAKAQHLIEVAERLYGGKSGMWIENDRITNVNAFEKQANVRDRTRRISALQEELKLIKEQYDLQKRVSENMVLDAQARVQAAKEASRLASERIKKEAELQRVIDSTPDRDADMKARIAHQKWLQNQYEAARAAQEKASEEQKKQIQQIEQERQKEFEAEKKRIEDEAKARANAYQEAAKKYNAALKSRYDAEKKYLDTVSAYRKLLDDQAFSREQKRLNQIISKNEQKASSSPWYGQDNDKRTKKEKKLDEGISAKIEKYGAKSVYGHLSMNEKKRYDEINEAGKKAKRAQRKIERMDDARWTQSEKEALNNAKNGVMEAGKQRKTSKENLENAKSGVMEAGKQKEASNESLSNAKNGVMEAANQMKQAGAAVNALVSPMQQLAQGIAKLNGNKVWFVQGE